MNTNMNQAIARPVSRRNITSQRDNRALLAVPAIGVAAVAASGVAALVTNAVFLAISTGSYGPREPAVAWADAHATDIYLTSHPLLLATCCALIVAATALAAFRRRLQAALLLCAAAATPWVSALAFIHHVWQLAPS